MKNIVVEVQGGLVSAVYCPDKTYSVHILDNDIEDESPEVEQYFKDVEEICNELVDCTSI
jgi:hypothetical protein